MVLEGSLILLAVVAIVWMAMSKTKKSKALPPGPRPYPLIGNIPHLAGKKRHVAMAELAEEYGKLYTLQFPGGAKCIVVNSAELAREALLTKRDAFSGRPITFIGNYFTRGGVDIICADFTEAMVLKRKISHSVLRMFGSGLRRLEGSVSLEVEQLCKRLRAHNGAAVDPKRELGLAQVNVICQVVYGERYDIDDADFKKINLYNDIMARIFGSFNLIDLFPWLRFLPMQDARDLREAVALRDSVLNPKFEEHKRRFREDTNNNNFEVHDLMDAFLLAYHKEQNDNSNSKKLLTEDSIVMTMHDIINAGFETTLTSLRWLLAYLVTYPEVQARAQAELDDVIGCGRLPRLDDHGSLPYLESVIAETLRLATIVPLAVPHKATRDATLGGYDVPKDTMLVTNTWAIHHDDSQWERPFEFDPERFLDSEGKFIAAGAKSYLPFSAGRRGCLGESLAKSELFLFTSQILHQFHVHKSPDEPLPDLDGVDGVIHTLHPYKICFKERL